MHSMVVGKICGRSRLLPTMSQNTFMQLQLVLPLLFTLFFALAIPIAADGLQVTQSCYSVQRMDIDSGNGNSRRVTAVKINIYFDQPIFVNERSITELLDPKSRTLDSISFVEGLTRLSCKGRPFTLVESHPFHATTEGSQTSPYHHQLMPFFPYFQSEFQHNLQVHASNAYDATLLFYQSDNKELLHRLPQCELAFLPKDDQDWINPTELRTAQGIPFLQSVKLRECTEKDAVYAHEQAEGARTATTATTPSDPTSSLSSPQHFVAPDSSLLHIVSLHHRQQHGSGSAVAPLNGTNTASSNPLLPQGSSGNVFIVPDLYSPSPIPTVDGQMFAMVQILEGVQNQHEVKVQQVLEWLGEPIANIGGPMVVQVIIDIIYDLSIDAISGIIEKPLIDPLIKPIIEYLMPPVPEAPFGPDFYTGTDRFDTPTKDHLGTAPGDEPVDNNTPDGIPIPDPNGGGPGNGGPGGGGGGGPGNGGPGGGGGPGNGGQGDSSGSGNGGQGGGGDGNGGNGNSNNNNGNKKRKKRNGDDDGDMEYVPGQAPRMKAGHLVGLGPFSLGGGGGGVGKGEDGGAVQTLATPAMWARLDNLKTGTITQGRFKAELLDMALWAQFEHAKVFRDITAAGKDVIDWGKAATEIMLSYDDEEGVGVVLPVFRKDPMAVINKAAVAVLDPWLHSVVEKGFLPSFDTALRQRVLQEWSMLPLLIWKRLSGRTGKEKGSARTATPLFIKLCIGALKSNLPRDAEGKRVERSQQQNAAILKYIMKKLKQTVADYIKFYATEFNSSGNLIPQQGFFRHPYKILHMVDALVKEAMLKGVLSDLAIVPDLPPADKTLFDEYLTGRPVKCSERTTPVTLVGRDKIRRKPNVCARGKYAHMLSPECIRWNLEDIGMRPECDKEKKGAKLSDADYFRKDCMYSFSKRWAQKALTAVGAKNVPGGMSRAHFNSNPNIVRLMAEGLRQQCGVCQNAGFTAEEVQRMKRTKEIEIAWEHYTGSSDTTVGNSLGKDLLKKKLYQLVERAAGRPSPLNRPLHSQVHYCLKLQVPPLTKVIMRDLTTMASECDPDASDDDAQPQRSRAIPFKNFKNKWKIFNNHIYNALKMCPEKNAKEVQCAVEKVVDTDMSPLERAEMDRRARVTLRRRFNKWVNYPNDDKKVVPNSGHLYPPQFTKGFTEVTLDLAARTYKKWHTSLDEVTYSCLISKARYTSKHLHARYRMYLKAVKADWILVDTMNKEDPQLVDFQACAVVRDCRKELRPYHTEVDTKRGLRQNLSGVVWEAQQSCIKSVSRINGRAIVAREVKKMLPQTTKDAESIFNAPLDAAQQKIEDNTPDHQQYAVRYDKIRQMAFARCQGVIFNTYYWRRTMKKEYLSHNHEGSLALSPKMVSDSMHRFTDKWCANYTGLGKVMVCKCLREKIPYGVRMVDKYHGEKPTKEANQCPVHPGELGPLGITEVLYPIALETQPEFVKIVKADATSNHEFRTLIEEDVRLGKAAASAEADTAALEAALEQGHGTDGDEASAFLEVAATVEAQLQSTSKRKSLLEAQAHAEHKARLGLKERLSDLAAQGAGVTDGISAGLSDKTVDTYYLRYTSPDIVTRIWRTLRKACFDKDKIEKMADAFKKYNKGIEKRWKSKVVQCLYPKWPLIDKCIKDRMPLAAQEVLDQMEDGSGDGTKVTVSMFDKRPHLPDAAFDHLQGFCRAQADSSQEGKIQDLLWTQYRHGKKRVFVEDVQIEFCRQLHKAMDPVRTKEPLHQVRNRAIGFCIDRDIPASAFDVVLKVKQCVPAKVPEGFSRCDFDYRHPEINLHARRLFKRCQVAANLEADLAFKKFRGISPFIGKGDLVKQYSLMMDVALLDADKRGGATATFKETIQCVRTFIEAGSEHMVKTLRASPSMPGFSEDDMKSRGASLATVAFAENVKHYCEKRHSAEVEGMWNRYDQQDSGVVVTETILSMYRKLLLHADWTSRGEHKHASNRFPLYNMFARCVETRIPEAVKQVMYYFSLTDEMEGLYLKANYNMDKPFPDDLPLAPAVDVDKLFPSPVLETPNVISKAQWQAHMLGVPTIDLNVRRPWKTCVPPPPPLDDIIARQVLIQGKVIARKCDEQINWEFMINNLQHAILDPIIHGFLGKHPVIGGAKKNHFELMEEADAWTEDSIHGLYTAMLKWAKEQVMRAQTTGTGKEKKGKIAQAASSLVETHGCLSKLFPDRSRRLAKVFKEDNCHRTIRSGKGLTAAEKQLMDGMTDEERERFQHEKIMRCVSRHSEMLLESTKEMIATCAKSGDGSAATARFQEVFSTDASSSLGTHKSFERLPEMFTFHVPSLGKANPFMLGSGALFDSVAPSATAFVAETSTTSTSVSASSAPAESVAPSSDRTEEAVALHDDPAHEDTVASLVELEKKVAQEEREGAQADQAHTDDAEHEYEQGVEQEATEHNPLEGINAVFKSAGSFIQLAATLEATTEAGVSLNATMASATSAEAADRAFASMNLRLRVRDNPNNAGALPEGDDNLHEDEEITEIPDYGPLAQRCSEVLSATAVELLDKQIMDSWPQEMDRLINSTVTRVGSRELTKALTVALTDSIVNLILFSVSKPLLMTLTKMVTHTITPSIVYPLTSIMVQALTHNPREDYYCWHCEKNKMYCSYCQRSILYMHNMDHYAQYYARYYTNYYTHWYVFESDIHGMIKEGQM